MRLIKDAGILGRNRSWYGEVGCSMMERMYTTRQVAEAWSVNPETVRRLAARGLLRSVRVGSERRYPESALQEYLRRQDTAA
jgi:excisionase family DNA binding protein